MRTCPFTNCTVDLPDHLFACRKHWASLAKDAQARIHAAYSDYLQGDVLRDVVLVATALEQDLGALQYCEDVAHRAFDSVYRPSRTLPLWERDELRTDLFDRIVGERLFSYRGVSSLATWMHSVTRHELFSLSRSRRPARDRLVLFGSFDTESPLVDQPIDQVTEREVALLLAATREAFAAVKRDDPLIADILRQIRIGLSNQAFALERGVDKGQASRIRDRALRFFAGHLRRTWKAHGSPPDWIDEPLDAKKRPRLVTFSMELLRHLDTLEGAFRPEAHSASAGGASHHEDSDQ